MKLHFSNVAAQFARRASTPTAPQAAARPSCTPQAPPAQAVAENQHAQVPTTPRKRVRWPLALAGVLVLLAGTLAAKWFTLYRPPAVASYSTRLAELDTKLSRALASRLRAAGIAFDAAIVSVEPPACRHATCLLKGLRRQDLTGVRGRMSVRHTGNGWWSFAGIGELAELKFDVDAAAEMRRLLKSTPAGFPQASMPALAAELSGHKSVAAVGQEVAILLASAAPGERRQWLDLEGMRYLEEPDWDYFDYPRAYMDWCRTNALDLSAVIYPDQSYGLFASAMAVAPVEGKLWEQATPDDIISHPALRSIRPAIRSPFPPARDQTQTYLFRTGEGTLGILRVVELILSPGRLMIQYKVAQPGAALWLTDRKREGNEQ